MKPTARVSPSGSRNDYTQYNMNSRGSSTNYNSNTNYNSSSGYASAPYYMYSASSTSGGGGASGGNDSSNYSYSSYSTGTSYPATGSSYSATGGSSYSATGSSYPATNSSYSATSSYPTTGSSYSSTSYPTNSYDYEVQTQVLSQYNPIISSETSSHFPFSYGSTESSADKRKGRGYQPWVKRDSLKRPAPYAGGRGMSLMQKMGWNPGKGLGRSENGTLEPTFPEIKMNKRGLQVAQNTLNVPIHMKMAGGRKLQMGTIKLVTEGKNPVSILEEYCSKRKLEAPKYEAVVDEGPVHAKNFVFKVTVDGVGYTADKGSNVKKTARVEAAKKCLVELGVLPKEELAKEPKEQAK